MSVGNASSSLLSEVTSDSMDQELSFSASAVRAPNKLSSSPQPTQLPSWPKKTTTPSRPKAVSFNNATGSTELSFTVEQSTKPLASPIHQVEQQHVVDLERMHRHHIRDEESVTWQHVVRLCASSKLRSIGCERTNAAAEIRRQPADTNAEVAPVMKKYMKYLKNAPVSSEIDELRKERDDLEKKVDMEAKNAATLDREVAMRKSYTSDVLQGIADQEKANIEETHQKQLAAKAKHNDIVSQLAVQFRQKMEQNEKERLEKLRIRHAYTKLHGNYEQRVDRSEAVRLERLAKVKSHHSPQVVADSNLLKQQIQEAAEQRRKDAAALAERQAALQRERIETRNVMLESRASLKQLLERNDRAEQEAACRALKQGNEELEEAERERARDRFLNRMTCNSEFNEEIEALRTKRQHEMKLLWKEKHEIAASRRRVAESVSAAEKHNKAKLRIIDRQMADEAVIVNEATRRLRNRNLAERRRDEKMMLLEAETLNKHKVLEEIYSRRRLSPIDNALQKKARPSSESPNLQEKRLQCCEVVEEEERDRRKFIERHFPERTRVLPLNASDGKSMAFASVESLKTLQTSNPRLAELASRLAALEGEDRASLSPFSKEERGHARRRLTQRHAAQDAMRILHDDQDALPTIHDGVPKQHGVNRRLYPLMQQDFTKSKDSSFSIDEDDSEAVRNFVSRFYTEPIKRQEHAKVSAYTKAKGNTTTPPLRMTEKELSNVQERLYYTNIRHLSPMLERRMADQERHIEQGALHKISNEHAVERFYTTPLQNERVAVRKLDEQYLC